MDNTISLAILLILILVFLFWLVNKTLKEGRKALEETERDIK